MRCWPSGLVAQDRVEAFDIGTRVRDGLFARGSVCRAPNLLPSHTVSQGRAGHVDHRTWRALHARLKAVSRSVGELARELLDSAREPPMRRDHWEERLAAQSLAAGCMSTYKVHSETA